MTSGNFLATLEPAPEQAIRRSSTPPPTRMATWWQLHGANTLRINATTPFSERRSQTDQYLDPLMDLGLSLDPLTQDRTMYAGGNPINMIDEDGHAPYCDGCSRETNQLIAQRYYRPAACCYDWHTLPRGPAAAPAEKSTAAKVGGAVKDFFWDNPRERKYAGAPSFCGGKGGERFHSELDLCQDWKLCANGPGGGCMPSNIYYQPRKLTASDIGFTLLGAVAFRGRGPKGTPGRSNTGDLRAWEVRDIQGVVNASGRPLNVVGSAARGARRPGSDIDYTVGSASHPYLNPFAQRLPGLDRSHGILHGQPAGPSVRFEPW